MADKSTETSTPDYIGGYDDEMKRIITRRTAETHAAYLLPHLKPGMRGLDIGCGPGTISVGLASAIKPGEFYGIDMAESQVELATTAARERDLSNARFQVADAQKLPFPDDHFDVVHCHALLMHIPDTLAVLAEIRRVLKTGGILGARDYIGDSCFIEPDIGNLNGIWAMYVDLLNAKGGHPQMGRELPAKFDEAGFVEIEARGAFESFGTRADVAACAGFFISYFCGPPIADPAISQGIVTREEVTGWQEAAVVWNDNPGAFSAWAEGEAIGRNP